MSKRSSGLGDERGAVFVEKLIAYLPLMLTFFLTWELAEAASAGLMVQRASAAAGRAAVVVLPDDPSRYDGEPIGSFGGERREDIELAAGMILSAHPKLRSDFTVDVSDAPEGVGPIEVTISALYDCGTVSVLCGGDGAMEFVSTTTHVYQGAKYVFSDPSDVGGGAAALSEGGGGRLRTNKRPGSEEPGGADPKKPKECNHYVSPCADATKLTTVYRVIREDEDPSQGLMPKDPNANESIQSHVGVGSGEGYKSQYISTTKSLAIAKHWACKKKTKPLRIVRITLGAVSGSKTDLSCGDHPALTGATAKNFAVSSQEVLVEGTIPAGAVSQVASGPFTSKECTANEKQFEKEKKETAKERKEARDAAKKAAAECGCAA